MNVATSVIFLISHFAVILCQHEEEDTIGDDEESVTQKQVSTVASIDEKSYLSDMEIMKIYMTSANSLKLFWGVTPEDIKMNKTYGLFYDIDNKENLTEPKTVTLDPCIEVLNLEYCKKYFFAVAPLNNEKGKGINPNSSNVRSIITYMDPLAPPINLHVDFAPGRTPCLLIKWTASCRNLPNPLGYKIRLIENSQPEPNTNTLRTLLSTKFEQACTVPVHYGRIYEISVSNDIPGASFSQIVKLKIPDFIQPYDVRLAVNDSTGAFLLYWKEPYVPLCNGQYFYEVFVFDDKYVTPNTSYIVLRVNRPGIIYKGNRTDYTFGVDLVCCDYSRKSRLSELVHGSVDGQIEHIDGTEQSQIQ
ncbi:hypothetical protein HHI36_000004 [Cryptolaemus montrouzieri]|uniref:Uncharacterized protein n=1 Tax=Cryptolaemus montrouzieri TaxID=559131 RepID=A0ABD2P3G8_9CUCU